MGGDSRLLHPGDVRGNAGGAMTEDLLTLLSDALFALENMGIEQDLCERIREVLKAQGTQSSNVERGDSKLFDEMPF